MIVPTAEELERDFSGEVDYHIFNGGEMISPKSAQLEGCGNKTTVSVNYGKGRVVILGT